MDFALDAEEQKLLEYIRKKGRKRLLFERCDEQPSNTSFEIHMVPNAEAVATTTQKTNEASSAVHKRSSIVHKKRTFINSTPKVANNGLFDTSISAISSFSNESEDASKNKKVNQQHPHTSGKQISIKIINNTPLKYCDPIIPLRKNSVGEIINSRQKQINDDRNDQTNRSKTNVVRTNSIATQSSNQSSPVVPPLQPVNILSPSNIRQSTTTITNSRHEQTNNELQTNGKILIPDETGLNKSKANQSAKVVRTNSVATQSSNQSSPTVPVNVSNLQKSTTKKPSVVVAITHESPGNVPFQNGILTDDDSSDFSEDDENIQPIASKAPNDNNVKIDKSHATPPAAKAVSNRNVSTPHQRSIVDTNVLKNLWDQFQKPQKISSPKVGNQRQRLKTNKVSLSLQQYMQLEETLKNNTATSNTMHSKSKRTLFSQGSIYTSPTPLEKSSSEQSFHKRGSISKQRKHVLTEINNTILQKSLTPKKRSITPLRNVSEKVNSLVSASPLASPSQPTASPNTPDTESPTHPIVNEPIMEEEIEVDVIAGNNIPEVVTLTANDRTEKTKRPKPAVKQTRLNSVEQDCSKTKRKYRKKIVGKFTQVDIMPNYAINPRDENQVAADIANGLRRSARKPAPLTTYWQNEQLPVIYEDTALKWQREQTEKKEKQKLEKQNSRFKNLKNASNNNANKPAAVRKPSKTVSKNSEHVTPPPPLPPPELTDSEAMPPPAQLSPLRKKKKTTKAKKVTPAKANREEVETINEIVSSTASTSETLSCLPTPQQQNTPVDIPVTPAFNTNCIAPEFDVTNKSNEPSVSVNTTASFVQLLRNIKSTTDTPENLSSVVSGPVSVHNSLQFNVVTKDMDCAAMPGCELSGFIRIKAGGVKKDAKLKHYSVTFLVLDGVVKFTSDDKEYVLRTGNSIEMLQGSRFRIDNESPDIALLSYSKEVPFKINL